jgi:hypothetical protein
VLLSEEVGLEAHGVDLLPFPLVCLSFLTATKRVVIGDDTLFAFQLHLQGDHGSDGPGQTKLNSAVDHWRLVERNLR